MAPVYTAANFRDTPEPGIRALSAPRNTCDTNLKVLFAPVLIGGCQPFANFLSEDGACSTVFAVYGHRTHHVGAVARMQMGRGGSMICCPESAE